MNANRVPQFPPLLTAHAVATGRSVFDSAIAGAEAGSLGAGDLLWSMATDDPAFALVLEPEVSASATRQMRALLMVAIGDALGAIGPPNLALTFGWPDLIFANGAKVGQVRLWIADTAAASEVPSRAALGFELALAERVDTAAEPGHDLRSTCLHVEGCGELDRTDVLEAVSRHFLSWLDAWEHTGFRSIHDAWMARLKEPDKPVTVPSSGKPETGRVAGLDESGDLVLQTDSGIKVIVAATQQAVGRGMAHAPK
jgi:biotin-(acetyl-CoA carboxylase) ligase